MKFNYSEWYTLYSKCAMFGICSMLSYQGIKSALQLVQKFSLFEVPSLDRKDLTTAIKTAVAEGILACNKSDKNLYTLNKID